MSDFRAVAIEALLVAVIAVGFALAANAISPRGLRLQRDYFPSGTPAPQRDAVATRASGVAGPAMGTIEAETPSFARQGFRAATAEQMLAWLRDPQYQAGLVVFVDARDGEKYRRGHIPGAWPFNHYRAEEELPRVLPACLGALQVVVYCAGGDCEDSEFAAVMLRDAGVPAENLFVYAGGIAEWSAKNLALETGDRGSGELRPAESR